MNRLSPEFYTGATVDIAQKLLGKVLIHQTSAGPISGRIVETEAYLQDDPASHSFRGKTARTEKMFGPPGTAYIYLIYGMHYCFNVVTQDEGVGEAVLIRALEPLEGVSLMQQNRGIDTLTALCSGPAKLVEALGIGKDYNGHSLQQPPLFIEDAPSPEDVIVTTRIGIGKAADLPYRFYLKDNPFISKK